MSASTSLETVCPHCGAVNRLKTERLADSPNCGRCHQSLLTGQPQSASDASFARLIAKEQLPIVVDFWAAWCGPCKSFAPVFSDVAAQYRERARFVKINTEEAVATAQQWQIRSIPTLMVFHNGQMKAQLSGALPPAQFQQWLAQNGV